MGAYLPVDERAAPIVMVPYLGGGNRSIAKYQIVAIASRMAATYQKDLEDIFTSRT